MKVKSKRIMLKQRRAIVISDIHGNLQLLKRLLKKCQYQQGKDYLLLLGDMVEKGPNSLATLRMIMELAQHEYVEVLMGNCDAIALELLSKDDQFGVCHYLTHAPWRKHTLINEMAAQLGVCISLQNDYERIFQSIVDAFPKEFAFLQSLSHVLESEDYLFAHAGLELEQYPYASDAYTIMKNDRFASKAYSFDKMLICGHTPVISYGEIPPSANPWYHEANHIYSIDGGCGVNEDGQLNALVIENGQFHTYYEDDLTYANINADYQGCNNEVISIPWFHRYIEKTAVETDGVWCYHPDSDRHVLLPEDLLYQEGNRLCTKYFTNYQLTVKKGDSFGIIRYWKQKVYGKVNGCYGWIPRILLNEENEGNR